MTDERRLEVPSVGIARCLGSGSYEDGKFYWREGCDDCQRRYVRAGDGWAGSWIDPPPIIAFECEYRIGPDEIVALEALPMTDQPCLEVPFDEVEKWEKIEGSCARLYAAAEWGYKQALATSPPKPPTAIEIIDLSIEIDDAGLGIVEFARAALERWGHG